ncbi:MAG TPA: peptide chain release factor N(5)-glutamine methyltransferase [Casimicrobiaceae bacterium]|nr:peptide chain release factor N(5)-glutamine methyltransferase [Casimicrobiaceae bacterium]
MNGTPLSTRPDIDLTVRRALAQCGLVPLEAQVLLAHVLERDRAWLAAHATDVVARAALDRFFELAKRRRDGEPVAYLTGRREFWGLDLRINPAVLIPRPETETLVQAALTRLPADRAGRILDLGTGSGAIALALAHERPDAEVLAVDVSPAALDVAQANAQRLGLAHVRFAAADWYAGVPSGAAPFDLIAANPPYVAQGDPHLREGDLRFEPPAALASGADGLAALRVIVGGARHHLAPGGWLLVEHGHDQAEAVRGLFRDAGFDPLAAWRDLAGIVRVAGGRSA